MVLNNEMFLSNEILHSKTELYPQSFEDKIITIASILLPKRIFRISTAHVLYGELSVPVVNGVGLKIFSDHFIIIPSEPS